MRGPEEDKRDFHLQGLCRYLPHAVFSLCGYSLDSASERGMTRASPRTRCGVQKRTSETFIYGGCRYLPHEVFPLCKVSLDSASGRGMTERVTPHLDSGARRGQTRHSFTGSLPVTSCGIPPLRLLSGFRVGARNDRARHPAPRFGGQKRTNETFIYRVLPVFTSCCILPLRLLSGFRVGARNDKNASPRTRCGVQKRTSETFIYRVFAGIYLMQYSHFAATLWIPRRSA